MTILKKWPLIGLFVVLLVVCLIKRDDLKSIGFRSNSQKGELEVKVEFYESKGRKETTSPFLSVYPNRFKLAYTDLNSPTSLHGIFEIAVENIGAGECIIKNIEWYIKDGDRAITPPHRMRSFNLKGGQGVRLIYGPEIGASGKNQIKLSIAVKYVNPISRAETTESYSGVLNYDSNSKWDYSGNEFRTDPSTPSAFGGLRSG